MAKDIANEDIRDTDTYTYDILNNHEDNATTFLYVNDLDADVTISVEGTHDDDDDFADSITLETANTVASGSTDYDTAGYPWDKIRFSVVASSTPTSGTLTIKMME